MIVALIVETTKIYIYIVTPIDGIENSTKRRI